MNSCIFKTLLHIEQYFYWVFFQCMQNKYLRFFWKWNVLLAFSLEVKIDWCIFLYVIDMSVYIALISGHINNKVFRCTWWNYKSSGLHFKHLNVVWKVKSYSTLRDILMLILNYYKDFTFQTTFGFFFSFYRNLILWKDPR